MKQLIIIISVLSLLGMTVTLIAYGADTADINATVTAQNIALTVSGNTVAYGNVSLSSSKSTVDISASQTVTNTGNVNEDFEIKGYNTTGTGTAWTLAASIGANQYMHEFSTTATFPGTALTLSNQDMATGVAALGTKTLDLKIYTPSSTADYNEKTAKVTITATAS